MSATSSPLFQYMAEDHDRLDKLLQRALLSSGSIDRGAYDEFRKGLLRHIGMEERVMLPALARMQGSGLAPLADRLRLDHGAIVALLVPPPSATIVATLTSILEKHNTLEESNGGVYAQFDQLPSEEIDILHRKLLSTPDVRVMPFNDRPGILEATARALARAGYTFTDITPDPGT
jgi:hypothetical protein